MPAIDIGIDLGTTSSLVYSTGKGIVLKEPSIVAYDKDTEKIKAIGEEARQMIGRAGGNIEAIRPIRQGEITDYLVLEKMLKYFISKAMGRRAFRKPRISISVPSQATEVERRAMEEATYQAGAREVFLVEEPIAAAIGAGIGAVSGAAGSYAGTRAGVALNKLARKHSGSLDTKTKLAVDRVKVADGKMTKEEFAKKWRSKK